MRTSRILAVLGWTAVALVAAATAEAQIPWLTDWRQARDLAHQQKRLVLLHFWSTSCEPCRRLEQHVFNRPEVIRAMSTGYIPVKINVEQDPQLTSHYQVKSWPHDVIVDPTGRVIHRQTSPQDPNQYIALLDSLKAHYGTTLAAAADLSSSSETSRPDAANGAELSLSGQPTPPRSNPRDSAYFQANQSPARQGPGGMSGGLGADPLAATPARDAAIAQPYANPYLNQPAPPSWNAALPAAQQGTPPRTTNLIENPHLRPGAGGPAGAAADLPPQSVYGAASRPVPGNAAAAPATQPAQHVADAPRTASLPRQQPSMALDGYCPVTLVEQNTWSKGDPEWGMQHRGRVYLFTSYVNQQRFRANPDLYSPVLSGYDPVHYFDHGAVVEGKREHGLYYGDQYFLFVDEASLERFQSAPQRYVAQTQAAMRGQ